MFYCCCRFSGNVEIGQRLREWPDFAVSAWINSLLPVQIAPANAPCCSLLYIFPEGQNLKKISTSVVGYLCICIAVIVSLVGCTEEQQKLQPEASSTKNAVVATSTLLATIADNESPDAPTAQSKHADMPQAEKQPGLFNIVMNPFGKGVAYIATVGNRVRVVHNGKPGKLYDEVESYTLTVSPDGQRVAYGARTGDRWAPVVDGREEGLFVERGRLAFSPDSRHVAYEAKFGNLWYLFVDEKKNDGAIQYFDQFYFSSDSNKVMRREVTADENAFRLIVSDLAFKKEIATTIHNPAAVIVSPDKTTIAAIRKTEGKQKLIKFSFNQPDVFKEGALYDEIRNPVFSQDSKALAYLAKKGADDYLVLNGKAERIPKGEYPWPPVIRPDNKGVGLIIVGQKGAFLHQAFLNDGSQGSPYKECANLTYSRDGKHLAYVAIKNEKFTIVVNGKEGPFFDRTISPQFSPDGEFLVYRARQDGKRFVVVADVNGTIIRQHPGYERVFETAFTEDGKSVAYGAKDGKQLWWKVEKL
jgi:hypothetical protein